MFLFSLFFCQLVNIYAQGLENDPRFKAFRGQLEIGTQGRSDILFVLDESGSIGAKRFPMEAIFVKVITRLIGVSRETNRVAVMTYATGNDVRFNYIVDTTGNNMCTLINEDIPAITEKYAAGSTYTHGALEEARDILIKGRPNVNRIVILISDGQSNGPGKGEIPSLAKQIKGEGITIFTVGIADLNDVELNTIASSTDHVFMLTNFDRLREFNNRLSNDTFDELFDRVTLEKCDSLCSSGFDCCDSNAVCSCGSNSGFHACACQAGYHGNGRNPDGCTQCERGTYKPDIGETVNKNHACLPCPQNSITSQRGSISIEQCYCKKGYEDDPTQGTSCDPVRCDTLSIPEGGVLIPTECGNTYRTRCNFKCRHGYILESQSHRECRATGFWSGNDFRCKKIVCPSLPIPEFMENERHNCSTDDLRFGTACYFQCQSGFRHIGPSMRTCEIDGTWSGKDVTCHSTPCSPLFADNILGVIPADCATKKKVFNDICLYKCADGFELSGYQSRERLCLANGTWMNADIDISCEDVTPPKFLYCPMSLVAFTAYRKPVAEVKLKYPQVSDNKDGRRVRLEVIEPKSYKMNAGIFYIKETKIVYRATDKAGHRSYCNFTVTVIDREPPFVMHCPSDIVVESFESSVNVSWGLPVFKDNSGKSPRMHSNRSPGSIFYWVTAPIQIVYTATDQAGNTAYCKFSVQVKQYACPYQAPPLNGALLCDKWLQGQFCSVQCNENFTFVTDPEVIYYCQQNKQTKKSVWRPLVSSGADFAFPWPDCSAIRSSAKGTVGVGLGFPSITCDDSTESKEKIAEALILLFKNMFQGIVEFCPPDQCVAQNVLVVCGATTSTRNRRDVNSKTMIFFDIAVSSPGTKELRLNETSTYFTNITDNILSEIEKNVMEERFVLEVDNVTFTAKHDSFDAFSPFSISCDPGQVAKQDYCVNCPVGTYNKFETGECVPCPHSTYQDEEGTTICKPCPNSATTAMNGRKWLHDCRHLCQPGTYSDTGLETCLACSIGTFQEGFGATDCISCDSKSTTWTEGAVSKTFCSVPCRPGHFSSTGFEPCYPCPLGYYQVSGGQKDCSVCPSGLTTKFEGTHAAEYCQNVTRCELFPCVNGGTCLVEDIWSVGPPCLCSDGYTGKFCETVLDRCQYSTCYNNGTCVNGREEFTCICDRGFSGITCLVDIDDCESNPCQNDGRCHDNIAAYHCECSPGFTGNNCEIKYSQCKSESCQNGGSCFDLVKGFRCCCVPGYTGSVCEQEVNTCQSNPCQNGAVCQQSFNNFSCNCVDGFSGIICEINDDDCLHNPCRNAGTCVDMVADYLCLCTSGFSGKQCQQQRSLDFDLIFDNAFTAKNAHIPEAFPMLYAFTLSLWMKTSDTTSRGTPVSYAYRKDSNTVENGLTLQDYKSFQLYINGITLFTDTAANSGFWHHIVVTWDSIDGSWSLFLDNKVKAGGLNVSRGQGIYGNGTFVIGQDQDFIGGRFSSDDAFVGIISQVNLWGRILSSEEIHQLYAGCSSHHVGDVISWMEIGNHLHGDVKLDEPSSLCTRITECFPSTCLNGGICIELSSGGTQCKCLPGYHGDECQTLLESCSDSFCNNHGYCFQDVDFPSCTCLDGFTGLFCEQVMNCSAGFCKNGGSCLHGVGCVCGMGLTGDVCQYDVDECFWGNGGCEMTCDNVFGSYTCSCSAGYLLHQDRKSCIDPTYCEHKGTFYLNGETWDENCQVCQCVSGYVLCQPVQCPDLHCGQNEHSFHIPGECCQKCVKDGLNCSLGQLNKQTTFDGKQYTYSGDCLYVLSRDCINSDFSIYIQQQSGKKLIVYVLCDKLTIFGNGTLLLGEREMTVPFETRWLRLSQTGDNVILVDTHVGVRVMWKRNGTIVVTVPEFYRKKLCGLCGNMDGDQANDMTTQQSLPARTTKEFMLSWKVEGHKHCSAIKPSPHHRRHFNSIIRPQQANRCIFKSLGEQLRVKQTCNILRSNAFRPCFRVVPPQKYYTRCLQDTCTCGHNEPCFCETFAAYANECRRNGVNISHWKNKFMCDLKCGGGKVYDDCGPVCPETCHSFWIGRNNPDCLRHACVPGCNCLAGMVLSNDQCISPSSCPEKFSNRS